MFDIIIMLRENKVVLYFAHFCEIKYWNKIQDIKIFIRQRGTSVKKRDGCKTVSKHLEFEDMHSTVGNVILYLIAEIWHRLIHFQKVLWGRERADSPASRRHQQHEEIIWADKSDKNACFIFSLAITACISRLSSAVRQLGGAVCPVGGVDWINGLGWFYKWA